MESAGGITEGGPDDDVGLRQGALESMKKHVDERFGDGGAADAEGDPEITDNACEKVADSTHGGAADAEGAPEITDNACEPVADSTRSGGVVQARLRQDESMETAGVPDDDVEGAQENIDNACEPVADSTRGADAADKTTRKLKYPRVAPPEVEDEVGQAVREDTPGYIAKAFPKLLPHGTGDLHELRHKFPKLLSFEEWGRFVMMWHDGRFMRHARFRYWLLDTSLRMMTPTMKRTFFKTREAATEYTSADLEDKGKRKNLVQQMSSATNKLPGSVGERRKMRQELEAMVHQIETETADNGENGGAGRIPAGFSTMTCAVYKWEQLHTTVSARLCQRCRQRPAYARVLRAVAFSARRQQREGRGHEKNFLRTGLAESRRRGVVLCSQAGNGCSSREGNNYTNAAVGRRSRQR